MAVSAGPRVRRPKQTTFGPVRVIFVEGAGYKVVPVDPNVRAAYGPASTLLTCRREGDAADYCRSGAAAEALARLLAQEAA